MNPIGKHNHADRLPDKADVRVSVWLLGLAMIAYPVIKYALRFQSEATVVEMLASAVAFPLAIYVFRGVPSATITRSARWLVVPALIGLIVAYRWRIPGELVTPSTEWLLILGTGVITGAVAVRAHRPLVAYLAGLACLVTGFTVMLWPHWLRIMDNGPELLGYMLSDTADALRQAGFAEGLINRAIDWGHTAGYWIIRLVPITMVMSVVTQFSVGFLWFAFHERRDHAPVLTVRPFERWVMPRWTLGILGVGLIVTGLFSGGVAIVADNVIAGLSVYFCATGLALVQGLMMRWQWPVGARVVVYIVFGVTGLIGYAVSVVLGVVDSVVRMRRHIPTPAV